MKFRELVMTSRSYRRFDGNYPVTEDTVRELVELACYVPSARNLQPLKYIAVCEPATVAALYPSLFWAGYLADWPGPVEGERPPAFIVILVIQESPKILPATVVLLLRLFFLVQRRWVLVVVLLALFREKKFVNC